MSSPQAHLVLTVIGADRPGLVSAVSAPVERHGGSWQQSQMARLAGEFAGIVLVSVPEAAVEALEADLRKHLARVAQVRLLAGAHRGAHARTERVQP